MSTRKTFGFAYAVCLGLIVLGLALYPLLPDPMVSHWNVRGAGDGAMPKLLGVLLVPAVVALIISLCAVIPRIDPLRNNIEIFRDDFNRFVVLFVVVLAAIQVATLARNVGADFNMMLAVMPGVGILLFYIGILLPKTRRNYFIGIRTPWTVASDYVWERTHYFGGRVFKMLGLLAIFTIVAPSYSVVLFIGPLMVGIAGLILYSYVVHRHLERLSRAIRQL